MITKNATLGSTKNVTVCELGLGDVWILGSEIGKEGYTVLGFKTIAEPKPIGCTIETSVKSFDEMEPELAFIFRNTESIDCLIEMLQGCKSEMEKNGCKLPDL